VDWWDGKAKRGDGGRGMEEALEAVEKCKGGNAERWEGRWGVIFASLFGR